VLEKYYTKFHEEGRRTAKGTNLNKVWSDEEGTKNREDSNYNTNRMKQLFIIMLCFVGLAATAQNHWEPDVSRWDNYQVYTAYVVINGVEQTSASIEVAAFIDGECRGSSRLVSSVPLEGRSYLLFLQVWGSTSDNGKPIALKVYDHSTDAEYTAREQRPYEYNGAIGNPSPVAVTVIPTLPNITTSSLPGGSVGTYYSAPLSATGDLPMTWSLASGSLPAGLMIFGSTISGTPLTPGSATFSVKATNAAGNASKQLTVSISPTSTAPTITTTSLSDGTENALYTATLTAVGDALIAWTLTSGSLPDGLSLSAGGVISGKATATGTFTFTVKASNTAGYDAKTLTIIIASPPVAPVITTTYLLDAGVGVPYSATLTATGTTPISWSIVYGALPSGMTLSSAGVISGTPTATGTSIIDVTATNAAGSSAAKRLYFTVLTEPPVLIPKITTRSLPSGTVGMPYSATVEATGDAPLVWSIVAGEGDLPPGLTFSTANGAISGTPTAVGSFTFRVQVSNTASYDMYNFTITITTPDQDIDAAKALIEGQTYTAPQIDASTVAAARAYVEGVIAGLNLNGVTATVVDGVFTPAVAGSSGSLSGVDGSYTFTVKLNRGAGTEQITTILTLAITATAYIPVSASITTTILPGGVTGTAYSETLTATGDYAIAWSLAGGALPDGLTLSAAAGTISGTPANAGTFNFAVKASNGVGDDIKALSIVVYLSDNDAISAAKALIEGQIYAEVQANAGSLAEARAYIK
jgi:hypothetical protein